MARRSPKTPRSAPAQPPPLLEEPEFFSHQITAARRFDLQLNPPWTAPLVVVCGGNEHTASDYRITRTNFPYYVVEFVASGEGILEMQENLIRGSSGRGLRVRARDYPTIFATAASG